MPTKTTPKKKTDKATTILGLIAGAVVASQANIPAAIAGDTNELGKLVLAIVAGTWGVLTNK